MSNWTPEMLEIFLRRILNLKTNLRDAGFTAEAMRLEHRLTHPDQLDAVAREGNRDRRDLLGYAIRENERDTILIGWEPYQTRLVAYLLRRNRAPFLVCDEDEVYARKTRRNGRMASLTASSSSGHATSIRLPTDLRDLLRCDAHENGVSVSSAMVAIIADHYRARRKYD
jgi:hypothetical protein